MNYFHHENSDAYKTLHDCFADCAHFENGVLDFEFSDGFWVMYNHPKNNLDNTVRTDSSKIEYILESGDDSDITVYVFESNIFGRTLRKEWNIRKLVKEINNGYCSLWFLTQGIDGNCRLIEGVLMMNHRPYTKECLIKLNTSTVKYHWNNLCEDKVW